MKSLESSPSVCRKRKHLKPLEGGGSPWSNTPSKKEAPSSPASRTKTESDRQEVIMDQVTNTGENSGLDGGLGVQDDKIEVPENVTQPNFHRSSFYVLNDTPKSPARPWLTVYDSAIDVLGNVRKSIPSPQKPGGADEVLAPAEPVTIVANEEEFSAPIEQRAGPTTHFAGNNIFDNIQNKPSGSQPMLDSAVNFLKDVRDQQGKAPSTDDNSVRHPLEAIDDGPGERDLLQRLCDSNNYGFENEAESRTLTIEDTGMDVVDDDLEPSAGPNLAYHDSAIDVSSDYLNQTFYESMEKVTGSTFKQDLIVATFTTNVCQKIQKPPAILRQKRKERADSIGFDGDDEASSTVSSLLSRGRSRKRPLQSSTVDRLANFLLNSAQKRKILVWSGSRVHAEGPINVQVIWKHDNGGKDNEIPNGDPIRKRQHTRYQRRPTRYNSSDQAFEYCCLEHSSDEESQEDHVSFRRPFQENIGDYHDLDAIEPGNDDDYLVDFYTLPKTLPWLIQSESGSDDDEARDGEPNKAWTIVCESMKRNLEVFGDFEEEEQVMRLRGGALPEIHNEFSSDVNDLAAMERLEDKYSAQDVSEDNGQGEVGGQNSAKRRKFGSGLGKGQVQRNGGSKVNRKWDSRRHKRQNNNNEQSKESQQNDGNEQNDSNIESARHRDSAGSGGENECSSQIKNGSGQGENNGNSAGNGQIRSNEQAEQEDIQADDPFDSPGQQAADRMWEENAKQNRARACRLGQECEDPHACWCEGMQEIEDSNLW